MVADRFRLVLAVLALALAALWLWSERYEYLGCDDGYCTVADKWTGEVGTRVSKLKQMDLRKVDFRAGSSMEQRLRHIAP